MTPATAEAADAAGTEPAPPRLWVLLGRRTGDNRQLAALADATGLAWTAKPLAFATLEKSQTVARAGSLEA